MKKLQTELKELAIEIRQLKDQRKESRYGYVSGLDNKRSEARHKHIAYSMLRGNTYEEIEPNCAGDNQPDMDYVKQLMEKYNEKVICTELQEAI